MKDGTKYARYTINKINCSAKAKVSRKISDLPVNHVKYMKGTSLLDLEMKIKEKLDFAGVQKRKNQWVFLQH